MSEAEVFSRRLRAATRVQHETAEESPFMTALTSGRLSGEAYAALAGQLWFVYSALEEAGAALAADPVVAPFLFAELNRRAPLEADLEVLLGAHWRRSLTPTRAATEYAARIRTVATTWAPGYLAHHYTRYLGDLSGGQILRRVLAREYDLEQGLSFFEFDAIARPKLFKDGYRSLLDGVPLEKAQQDRVIDEARLAFDLNTALFRALGEQYPGSAPPEVQVVAPRAEPGVSDDVDREGEVLPHLR